MPFYWSRFPKFWSNSFGMVTKDDSTEHVLRARFLSLLEDKDIEPSLRHGVSSRDPCWASAYHY
jgi:hypothetical protein